MADLNDITEELKIHSNNFDDNIDALEEQIGLAEDTNTILNDIKDGLFMGFGTMEAQFERLIEVMSGDDLQGKEDKLEAKAAQERMIAALEKIEAKLGSGGGGNGGNGGGGGRGFLAPIGGLLKGAAGFALMGAAVAAFFGGLVAGDKLLGAATDWMNADFNLPNIKKAVIGFSGIIKEMDEKTLLTLGVLMGASSFGSNSGVKSAIGLSVLGAGIAGFFGGLLLGDATLGFLQTDFDYENIKKATSGFASIFKDMDDTALTALGVVFGSSLLTSLKGTNPLSMGIALTALGAGIAGFFGTLAAADVGLGWINTDWTSLPKAAKGFADTLSVFSGDAGIAMAGLLGGAGLLGILGTEKMKLKFITGLAALSGGILAFVAPLAASDAIIGKFGDGTGLKTMMKNFADGIHAFSGPELLALFAAGGLLAVAGPAADAAFVLGMGALGLGIGGFFTALSGMGEVANLIGTDGSKMATLMQNTADGIKAFGDLDGVNLLAVGTALPVLAAGMAAWFASDKIGSIIDGMGKWYDSMFGGDETDTKNNKARMLVDSIMPFSELGDINFDAFDKFTSIFDKFSTAIERFMDISSLKFKSQMRDLVGSLSEGAEALTAMMTGGKFELETVGLNRTYNFGAGLNNIDLGKLREVVDILGESPTFQASVNNTADKLSQAELAKQANAGGPPVIVGGSNVNNNQVVNNTPVKIVKPTPAASSNSYNSLAARKAARGR